MEASELRIGNFVYYGESIRKITAIGNSPQRKFVGVDNLITELHIIRPIELSPEILEKAGFEEKYNDKDHWVHPKLNFIGTYYLPYKVFRDAFCFKIDQNTAWYTRVEYLHQLQNLYWCLCGEELIIKIETPA